MRQIFCSKCNTQLIINLKALKQFGVVIGTVDPHTCPDIPLELPFQSVTVPIFDGKKSVQKLDKQRPSIGTDTLGDRRSAEHIKQSDSTAPFTLLQQMRDMHNSTPANDPEKEPPND
jgi:hypothetical protein